MLTPDEINLLVGILQKPERLSESGRALRDYAAKIRERHEEQSSALDLNELRDRIRERKGYHS